MRGAWALAGLMVVAGPGGAEEALISIRFGGEEIAVAAGQLVSVDLRLSELVPSLRVTLTEDLAGPLAALTGAHVGEIGEIRVCGRLVSEPVLRGAITAPVFILSDPNPDDIRRLDRVLRARDCAAGV